MMKGRARQDNPVDKGYTYANRNFFCGQFPQIMTPYGTVQVNRIVNADEPGRDLKGLPIGSVGQRAKQGFIQNRIDSLLVIKSSFWQTGDFGFISNGEVAHGFKGVDVLKF